MLRFFKELTHRISRTAIASVSPDTQEPPVNDSVYEAREWETPDKSRRLTTLVRRGPKYGNFQIKEVMLQIKVGQSYLDLMHVEAISEVSGGGITYKVKVQAIDDRLFWDPQKAFALQHLCYGTDQAGKIQDMGIWTSPIDRGHTDEFGTAKKERLRTLCEEGEFVFVSQLPPIIDVQATVEAFMQQVKAQDFSRPPLILPKDLPDSVR